MPNRKENWAGPQRTNTKRGPALQLRAACGAWGPQRKNGSGPGWLAGRAARRWANGGTEHLPAWPWVCKAVEGLAGQGTHPAGPDQAHWPRCPQTSTAVASLAITRATSSPPTTLATTQPTRSVCGTSRHPPSAGSSSWSLRFSCPSRTSVATSWSCGRVVRASGAGPQPCVPTPLTLGHSSSGRGGGGPGFKSTSV